MLTSRFVKLLVARPTRFNVTYTIESAVDNIDNSGEGQPHAHLGCSRRSWLYQPYFPGQLPGWSRHPGWEVDGAHGYEHPDSSGVHHVLHITEDVGCQVLPGVA